MPLRNRTKTSLGTRIFSTQDSSRQNFFSRELPQQKASSAENLLQDDNFLAMRIFPTLIPGVCRAARAMIATALTLTALAAVARAQAPAPPPGPPPQTRPSVPTLPGAPSPLVSVPGAVATPLATPVAIPTAVPTPAARLFNCSCFTTVSGTQWSGTVTASSYAAARSAASGACFSYLTSSPQSPFIQPGQSPGLGNGNSAAANAASSGTSANPAQPPGTGASALPSSVLKNSPALTGQTSCNVCACN
jgi:hypothetical protein